MFHNKETSSFRLGGRVLLVCQLLSVGVVAYLTYTHKSVFTYHHYGERLVVDHPSEKKESKLLSSRWIKLFPHLQHLVVTMETNSDDIEYESTTSANYTTVSVKSSKPLVGGTVAAVIQARNHRNLAKTYGGDFFIVTLRRPGRDEDGVLCEVNDRMNGLYDITCFTPWPGDAKLSVIMLHPSESVYHMIKTYSSVTEYGVIMNTTLLRVGTKSKEFTRCSIGFPDMSQEQLCDYSNPTHGEPWTCVRPESGECSEIVWQEKIQQKALRFFDNLYFQKGVNHNVEINGSGVTVQGLQPALKKQLGWPTKSFYLAQNNQVAETKSEIPSGWFFDGKWTSRLIKSKEYSAELMRTCLRNKEIYFIGDSTTRQWFSRFASFFKLKQWGPDNSKVWPIWRDASSKLLNLTIHYRSHGPPLHNLGPPVSRPYVTNTLDNITTGGEGTIVVVNVGLHFELYDADVFGNRIAKIREALELLLSRLPGVQVFIRGMHVHDYSGLCPSAWLSYRYDVMLRNEFANMKGVTFLDMWGLSILLNNRPVHPGWSVLQKQVGLFLSHVS